jgi:WD40 repeat protein
MTESITDVSSVHWNGKGDHLVTSASDCVARIWKLDESDGTQIEIENIKNFDTMLMNSKFNKGASDLIATAVSGKITVWDTVRCKDVAKFDHLKLDPNFISLEIEWQNSKTVAVAGISKTIYLWNVDQPDSPKQIWNGHKDEVKQITWDPNGQLLASCSNDNLVCIWKPGNSQPEHRLDGHSSPVSIIRWSNKEGDSDPLLAVGCLDNQVLVWNVRKERLVCRLQAGDGE